MNDPEFQLLIQFCFLVSFMQFLLWLGKKISPTPEYVVMSKNDSTGTEVRYNGRSVKLHINDEKKFQAHLIAQQTMVLEDLRRQGHNV